MADTEIKQELAAIPDPTPMQERPRFVKKQRDPAQQAQVDRAWADLERVRQQVSARFADCSEEELDAIADEIVRDAIESLVRKGRIYYESNPPS